MHIHKLHTHSEVAPQIAGLFFGEGIHKTHTHTHRGGVDT
jgi:hypothetical protein